MRKGRPRAKRNKPKTTLKHMWNLRDSNGENQDPALTEETSDDDLIPMSASENADSQSRVDEKSKNVRKKRPSTDASRSQQQRKRGRMDAGMSSLNKFLGLPEKLEEKFASSETETETENGVNHPDAEIKHSSEGDGQSQGEIHTKKSLHTISMKRTRQKTRNSRHLEESKVSYGAETENNLQTAIEDANQDDHSQLKSVDSHRLPGNGLNHKDHAEEDRVTAQIDPEVQQLNELPAPNNALSDISKETIQKTPNTRAKTKSLRQFLGIQEPLEEPNGKDRDSKSTLDPDTQKPTLNEKEHLPPEKKLRAIRKKQNSVAGSTLLAKCVSRSNSLTEKEPNLPSDIDEKGHGSDSSTEKPKQRKSRKRNTAKGHTSALTKLLGLPDLSREDVTDTKCQEENGENPSEVHLNEDKVVEASSIDKLGKTKPKAPIHPFFTRTRTPIQEALPELPPTSIAQDTSEVKPAADKGPPKPLHPFFMKRSGKFHLHILYIKLTRYRKENGTS